MPLSGKQLSYKWSLALCKHVGFRAERLVEAVSVMCSESDRYPLAYNENRTTEGTVLSTDRGLFQINDKAHPNFSDADAFDSVKNAAYAFNLSKEGRDWTPWMGYNSGVYFEFLPIADMHLENAKAGLWSRTLDARVETIASGGTWPGGSSS